MLFTFLDFWFIAQKNLISQYNIFFCSKYSLLLMTYLTFFQVHKQLYLFMPHDKLADKMFQFYFLLFLGVLLQKGINNFCTLNSVYFYLIITSQITNSILGEADFQLSVLNFFSTHKIVKNINSSGFRSRQYLFKMYLSISLSI